MKIFEDGSTYDSRNGYRSAELVKQQEEDGTFVPPGLTDKERSNLQEGALLLLGVIIAVAVVWTSLLFYSMNKELQSNKNTIESTVVNSEVFGYSALVLSHSDDEIIVQAMTGEGAQVVKCDVSYVHNEEKTVAYLFCGSPIATLTIGL